MIHKSLLIFFKRLSLLNSVFLTLEGGMVTEKYNGGAGGNKFLKINDEESPFL
jgi:hypothetical protein